MAKQRNITVSVTGALPLDGYKAVLQRIADYERRIGQGEAIAAIDSLVPDPAVKQVCTSLSAYEAYVLDLTDFDPVAGDYKLTLVEILPS